MIGNKGGKSSTERESRRRLVKENRVPATRTTLVRTLLLLGWNTASDLEAEGMHFRKGGHREEGATPVYCNRHTGSLTSNLSHWPGYCRKAEEVDAVLGGKLADRY